MNSPQHPAHAMAETITTHESDVQMVTGLLVAFTYIDEDGDNCWGFYTLPDQTSIITNGLADRAMFLARKTFEHEG